MRRYNKKFHGSSNGRARLTENRVRSIRHLAVLGYSSSTIAVAFKTAPRTVREVIARDTWRHI